MRPCFETVLVPLVCVLLWEIPHTVGKKNWKSCTTDLVKAVIANKTWIQKYKFLSKTDEICQHGGSCLYLPQEAAKEQSFIAKILHIKKKVVKCLCPVGRTGQFCETASCNPNPCKNNAKCKIVDGELNCDCAEDHTGETCESALTDTSGSEVQGLKCKKGKKLLGDVTCVNGKCKKRSKVVKTLKSYLKKTSTIKYKTGITELITQLEQTQTKVEVCECKPGFTGLYCNQTCNKTHGEYCRKACGHCHDKKPCKPTTGKCAKCEAGYKMPYCKDDPKYQCRKSQTCIQGDCDNATNSCVCFPGWQGPKCNQQCEENKWGFQCESTCGECEIPPCNHEVGVCFHGKCAPGYKSPQCVYLSTTVEARGGLDFTPVLLQATDPEGNVISEEKYVKQLESEMKYIHGKLHERHLGLPSHIPTQEKAFLTVPVTGVRRRRFEELVSGEGRFDGEVDQNLTDELYRKRQRRKAFSDQAWDAVVGISKMLHTAADLTTGKNGKGKTQINLILGNPTVNNKRRATGKLKRQAGSAALQADFTMGFPPGSVDEDGLQDGLTSNIQQASDEVEIPGLKVDKSSISVRAVGVVTAAAAAGDDADLNVSMTLRIAAGVVLLMGISALAMVAINRKNKKKRKMVTNNQERTRSKTASKKSATSASKSRASAGKSVSHTSKSRVTKRKHATIQTHA